GENDQIRDGPEILLAARRQRIKKYVETEMIILTDTDRGAQEDEPAHQHDGGDLCPCVRPVEDEADEYLPHDDARHQHKPGTCNIKCPVAYGREHACEPFDLRLFSHRRCLAEGLRLCHFRFLGMISGCGRGREIPSPSHVTASLECASRDPAAS